LVATVNLGIVYKPPRGKPLYNVQSHHFFMDKAAADRQRFVEEHLEALNKMQAKLYGTMENVLVDRRMGGGGGLSFFEQLKVRLNFQKTSSSKMKSSDKLEYSKLFFEDIKDYRKTVMSDPGYKAVLKDIDIQLKAMQAELDQINEALRNTPDEHRRRELNDERERLGQRDS